MSSSVTIAPTSPSQQRVDHVGLQFAARLFGMQPHPPCVDTESHRSTRRTRRRPAAAVAALLCLAPACGGGGDGDVAEPLRSYAIPLTVDDSGEEYDFLTDSTVDIRVGDEVTFELDNTGGLIHDLHIVDPDGSTVARTDPITPGASTTLTALFDQVGVYRLSCFVDDHFVGHQMFTFVEVTEPDG